MIVTLIDVMEVEGALWFLQVIWNVDNNSAMNNQGISPFFQEQNTLCLEIITSLT